MSYTNRLREQYDRAWDNRAAFLARVDAIGRLYAQYRAESRGYMRRYLGHWNAVVVLAGSTFALGWWLSPAPPPVTITERGEVTCLNGSLMSFSNIDFSGTPYPKDPTGVGMLSEAIEAAACKRGVARP